MATFESTSNSRTFSDTSSYIYVALQTARNIIDSDTQNTTVNVNILQSTM